MHGADWTLVLKQNPFSLLMVEFKSVFYRNSGLRIVEGRHLV